MVPELLRQIEDQFNALSVNYSFKEPVFERNHIFYSVLEVCEKHIGIQEKLAMYHQFYCHEKVLGAARTNKLNMANYWIDYIDNLNFNYSQLPKDCLQGLYFPVIAFVDYCKNDFKSAHFNLDRSLDSFETIMTQGINNVLAAMTEQSFNKFRIFCKTKDYINIYYYAQQLLKLVNGVRTELFNYKVDEIVLKDKENDWEGIIHYYYNSILNKILLVDTAECEAENLKFWKEMSQPFQWEFSPIQEMRHFFISLESYYSREYDLFLSYFNDALRFVPKMPSQLQLITLNRFLDLLRNKFEIAEDSSIYLATENYKEVLSGKKKILIKQD